MRVGLLRDGVSVTRTGLRRARLRLVSDATLSPNQKWDRDGGNRLRTNDLQLTSDDLVLDFGGYLGEWAGEIVKRYGSTVHVFEPVEHFAAQISASFDGDDRIVVHNCAVGASSRLETLNLAGDSTAPHVDGEPTSICVRDVSFLESVCDRPVSLAKLNIEGGEYELIPALVHTGWTKRIDRLIIQFHEIDEESQSRREGIRAMLAETHRCDWEYPFVWESWTRDIY